MKEKVKTCMTGTTRKRGYHDRYDKEARVSLLTHFHGTDECPMKSAWQKLEDVVFTEADSRWMHHLHSEALVKTARVTNNNVHIMLVENGSAVDITYLDAYKRIGLIEGDLNATTTPLCGFTRDYVIPKGRHSL